MSFYGPNVKTHLIDPSYHNGTSVNPRSEFRVEANKAYMLNARLVNVGSVVASGGSGDPQQYPSYSGVLSLIKHIYVTDGKAQVDILRDVNKVGMQLNYKTSNSKANGMELRTLGNSLGFDSTQTKTTRENFFFFEDDSTKATDDINTTGKFYFSLSRLLGFFSQIPLADPQMPAFSTQFYKDFRIIIEWNTSNVFGGGDTVGQILEPLLVLDEVIGPMGEQFANSYKGCKFDALEYDRVTLDAIVPTQAVQEVNKQQYYKLDAFKGKYVKHLTWQAVNTTGVRGGVQDSYSTPLYKEQLRLGVNKNWGYLPWENGVSNYNIKLGLANQTLGSLNLCQGMSYPLAQLQEADINDTSSNAYQLQTTGGLGAVVIDQPIEELEAYHQRTGLYNHADNAGFYLNRAVHVHYLARVAKAILPTGDGRYDVFEDLNPYQMPA